MMTKLNCPMREVGIGDLIENDNCPRSDSKYGAGFVGGS